MGCTGSAHVEGARVAGIAPSVLEEEQLARREHASNPLRGAPAAATVADAGGRSRQDVDDASAFAAIAGDVPFRRRARRRPPLPPGHNSHHQRRSSSVAFTQGLDLSSFEVSRRQPSSTPRSPRQGLPDDGASPPSAAGWPPLQHRRRRSRAAAFDDDVQQPRSERHQQLDVEDRTPPLPPTAASSPSAFETVSSWLSELPVADFSDSFLRLPATAVAAGPAPRVHAAPFDPG